MHWFRSKIRSCGRLALFALALQMIVSFGHMHRDDLGLPPLAGTDSTSIASAAAPGAQPPPANSIDPRRMITARSAPASLFLRPRCRPCRRYW